MQRLKNKGTYIKYHEKGVHRTCTLTDANLIHVHEVFTTYSQNRTYCVCVRVCVYSGQGIYPDK